MKVLDGANTVAEYEYDGMNRRIVKKLYTGGTLTQTRHRYHTPGKDQVIEERVDASSNADRQFTWGTRYIDDLVMRTRDTNADGTLDETLYALTDITYDVVALTDATGAVVERFLYDPYGKSTVLDANFTLDSDGISDYDWEYRFTSREFDKETGLDYFRARYYSSGQGRFVNRDPLEYPDGMNAYAGYFAAQGLDPLGLLEEWMFHPNDHGGPHFQIKIGGKQCRYRSNDLSPIEHKGHTPQPLSKSAQKRLHASKAWQKWVKTSGGTIVLVIILDTYCDAHEKIEDRGREIAGCETWQWAITDPITYGLPELEGKNEFVIDGTHYTIAPRTGPDGSKACYLFSKKVGEDGITFPIPEPGDKNHPGCPISSRSPCNDCKK